MAHSLYAQRIFRYNPYSWTCAHEVVSSSPSALVKVLELPTPVDDNIFAVERSHSMASCGFSDAASSSVSSCQVSPQARSLSPAVLGMQTHFVPDSRATETESRARSAKRLPSNKSATAGAQDTHYAVVEMKFTCMLAIAPFRVAPGDPVVVEDDAGTQYVCVVRSVTTDVLSSTDVRARLVRHARSADREAKYRTMTRDYETLSFVRSAMSSMNTELSRCVYIDDAEWSLSCGTVLFRCRIAAGNSISDPRLLAPLMEDHLRCLMARDDVSTHVVVCC